MMVVVHNLLVSIYYMVRYQVPHLELGLDYFDQLHAQQLEHSYVRRLKALGFRVTLTPASSLIDSSRRPVQSSKPSSL